jgi:hypothetical protein
VTRIRSRAASTLLALLAAPAASGCAVGGAGPGPACPTEAGAAEAGQAEAGAADGWRWAEGEAGHVLLGWRPVAGALVRNEPASLDVVLRDVAGPAVEVRLVVRGWMPDHAHGLVSAPVVTPLGAGAYRVDGLLLHMRGRWQLLFDVSLGGSVDVVCFDLEL